MKRCSRCKCEFPLTVEFFPISRTTKDGYHNYCRTCTKEYRDEYRDLGKKKVSPTYRKILKMDYWNCNIKLSDRVLFSKKVDESDIIQLIREDFGFVLRRYKN